LASTRFQNEKENIQLYCNFIDSEKLFPLADDALKQKLKGLVGRRWGFESGRVFYSQRVKMPSTAVAGENQSRPSK
jgi:hypothetical protein